MFCSPLQPADPFEYFTAPPYHAYRRQQAYNDPITAALLQEQARREAIYEREREQRRRRRLAYEAEQQRQARAHAQAQAEREAAIYRARRIAAARQEYERQIRDLFFQGYRPASDTKEEAEEDQQANEEEPCHTESQASQSYIPIRSYEDPRQSETEASDAASESDSDSDDEEQLLEEDNTHQTSATSQAIQNDQPSRSQPTITYEEAVAIVQKHAQVAITVRRRLAALNKVRASFEAQRRQFQHPRTLDFDIPKSTAGDQPILSYTPNNRPLQAYEENLLRLLTDLDDIPSGGHAQVKKARKALASEIQGELSRIDSYKLQLWERR